MGLQFGSTGRIGLAGVSSAWMKAVLAVALLLICGVVGVLLYGARGAELQRASTEASNLSAAITQDLARNIELYDLSIQGVIEGVTRPSVMAAPKDLRQLILFDRAATAPFLGAMLVIDTAGNVVLDSASIEPRSTNYKDRDYFEAHAKASDIGLYVSQPLQSRTDGQWIMALSRRVNNPDGTFGGVVVGTLRLEYVHQLFARMKLGRSGSLTLFRTDGTIMMREPFNPADLGRNLHQSRLFDLLHDAPGGEYQSKSIFDGVQRLFHYQRVGALPLVQTVGLSLDDIYAEWWHKAIGISAVLIACCAMIAALTAALKAELRRRAVAEAALVLLAEEDGLTGTANRRRFDKVLAEELSRAVRHRTSLSLLMIDADQFKLYNDSFGHVGGDQALAALGACLKARAQRPGDLAARYGGEEFAIILPHTDANGAMEVAEAVRRDVLEMNIAHPRSDLGRFSVSVGVASVVPGGVATPNDLIAAADAALYASKTAGRNRSTLQQHDLEAQVA